LLADDYDYDDGCTDDYDDDYDYADDIDDDYDYADDIDDGCSDDIDDDCGYDDVDDGCSDDIDDDCRYDLVDDRGAKLDYVDNCLDGRHVVDHTCLNVVGPDLNGAIYNPCAWCSIGASE
jgi:hypothetical protein